MNLPMTIRRFCAGCGRRIVFDWVHDMNSEDNLPTYYHISCYEEKYGKTIQSSPASGLPPQSGEKG